MKLEPLFLLCFVSACVGDSSVTPPDGGSDATTDVANDVVNDGGNEAEAGYASGKVEWLHVYTTDEPNDLLSDAAHVAVAADGSIAIIGHYSGPTLFGTTTLTPTGSGANVFVAKLDATGKVTWAKTVGNLGAVLPAAVAMNDTGDVFLGLDTGGGTITLDGISATDNSSGAFAGCMFKLAAADGKAQWAYAFGAAATTSTLAIDGIAVHGTTIAVATHFQGNVQIVGTSSTGYTIGSAGQDALVTMHDDTQGGKIPHFSVMGSTGTDWIYAITADNTGAFYIGGTFATGITPLALTVSGGTLNAFVAKIDNTVAKVWAQNLGGAAPTSNIGHPLALATDGTDVYIVGGLWGYTSFNAPIPSTGSAGGEDGFLAQALTTDGTIKYARAIGGTSDDEVGAIAVGPSGFIALAGYYTSSSVTIGSTLLPSPQPGKPAAILAHAAGAGTYDWAKGAAAPNAADYVKAGGVAIDPKDGSVVVAGTFSGKVDLGDGTTSSSSSAGTHQAFYVMKVAP